MKRIVSVSLGSSKRDHRAEITVLGEQVIVERIGTDGDLAKAKKMLADLDGKVDAFGLGGIDRYLVAGNRRYEIKDAARWAKMARLTPVVDGSGLKNTLERRVIGYIEQELKIPLKGKKVLMVAGADRFGMAEALHYAGCQMVFGDLIFAFGIPFPITTLRGLQRLGAIVLPVITQLPFAMLYPTGSKQENHPVKCSKYTKYYDAADIIAGDFLYIKRYMPQRMDGKILITNTVTTADIEDLKQRGVRMLVTSTPEIEGRSFGTNVMEALLVAFSGKRSEELQEQDYLDLLDKVAFKPRVVKF